jgi:hypothetical protein
LNTRVCKTCGKEKPLIQFHKHRGCKDGRDPNCSTCRSFDINLWRKEHPETIRRTKHEYYERNKDRIIAKSRRQYGLTKPNVRNNQLKSRYGVTLEFYQELLASQGNKCAICGAEEPEGRGGFHLDHDHATGKVRGILCHRCNSALGMARDNPETLDAMAAYLREKMA